MNMNASTVILIPLTLATLVAIIAFAGLARTWVRAMSAGAPVALPRLLGIRLRGNPPAIIVDAYILLQQQHVKTSLEDVEQACAQNRVRASDAAQLAQIVKDRRSGR
jgi:uncharacterized protein YqfA (UPF0365 family)